MKPVPAAMAVAAVGLVAFFVYHWFFVAPVWAVFLEGLVWIAINGAAIGWAYQRVLLDQERTGTAWGFAYGGLMAATLVPALIVGLAHGPFPNGPTLDLILPVLPLAFMGVPASIVVAWWLGGWGKVQWPFVVACLPAGIMIGGSIATFGGTLDLFALFVALEVGGGGVLARLVRRGRSAVPRTHRQDDVPT